MELSRYELAGWLLSSAAWVAVFVPLAGRLVDVL